MVSGIFLLGLIGFWIYKAVATDQRQLEALSIIPDDAVYILETTQPTEN